MPADGKICTLPTFACQPLSSLPVSLSLPSIPFLKSSCVRSRHFGRGGVKGRAPEYQDRLFYMLSILEIELTACEFPHPVLISDVRDGQSFCIVE